MKAGRRPEVDDAAIYAVGGGQVRAKREVEIA